MRKPVTRSICLLTTCFLTGCIIPLPRPGAVTVAPELYGTVIDCVTKAPIAGAQVTVDDRPETTVFTGADGAFHISEVRKRYCMEFIEPGGVLGYCPPVGDVYWQICVTHPRYRDFNEEIDDQMDLAQSPTNPWPYHKKVPPIVLRPILLTPTR